MVFGMYLILIFLSIILSGCGLMKNNNNFFYSSMEYKNVKEILSIFNDGKVYFIGEPPCALSKIRILSEKKMVLVSLRISELPIDLRERLETCNWKIEEFYNYIPTEIKIDKIDQEYIRRSKIHP
jgi:hypothetical protein